MDISYTFPQQVISDKRKTSKWSEQCIDMPYLVYLHINQKTGCVYVGITKHVTKTYKRWHYGKGYRKNIFFYRAIEKYGWNNFKHFTEVVPSFDDACKREIELIAKFKSIGLCYNIANGGNAASSVSDETRKKLSKYTPWMKGKHHTEEAKKMISEAGKGRKMSEKTRLKLREANQKRVHVMSDETRKKLSKANTKFIPIYQIDPKTNKILARYDSARDAQLALNYTNSSRNHIYDVCNGCGNRKTWHGFKWRYTND